METLCQQNKIIHPNNSLRDLKNLAPQIESEPVVTINHTKIKKAGENAKLTKSEINKRYRTKHKEKIKSYHRTYYLANRETPKIKKPYLTGNRHHAWKGYGEIPRNYFGHVQKSAIKRLIKFDLTIEQAWNLFLKQNRCCSISGVKLIFNSICRSCEGTASLDRIDSAKGYEIDNVQWIHKDVNYMKNDMTDEELIKWCSKITDFKRSGLMSSG
jgi:hypothetical protein